MSLLFFQALMHAQTPYVQRIILPIPAGEPVFTRIVQDMDGYLWLGSDAGLYRYDGVSYRQFFPATDSVEFHITALFESSDGTLRAGCKDGKIYSLVGDQVQLFNPEEGTAGEAITDIILDDNGILWWSTSGEGIYLYTDNRVYNINHDDGLPDDYVYDLEYDHSGMIWAATDAGIVECSFEDGRKTARPLPVSIILPDVIVRVIKEDARGRLWLGFQDGGAGYIVEDRSGFIKPFPETGWPYGQVQDILFLQNVVWVATASGKLVEINPGPNAVEIRSILNGGPLKTGKINDLAQDREGNVWIVSVSGIYKSTGTKLMYLSRETDQRFKNIHAVRNDIFSKNALWFSSDEGLFLYNLLDGTAKQYLQGVRLPNLEVVCLFQDNLGFIWAGTFNYGVFRISPADGTWFQITESQGLVNNNVLSISGHNDTIWMATLGGASELILKGKAASGPFSIISHNRENGLVNNFIYAVFEDPYDQIWFATDGDGISVRTKKGWFTYGEKEGLTDDVIYSITGDKFGNIWIASASKGIFKFNDGRFTRYGMDEGLGSLDITGISVIDEEVLIIRDDGIDIMHIPTGRIAHYGDQPGLSGISPDLNVISKDLEGNAWIGTRTGIIRYQPEPGNSAYGPQTVLEELSVYLEPREMKDGMVLGYNQNHVSFRYSGLWYSNPEKVTYQVLLDGYDLGWKDTYDRQVTYSSLPPGKYTFKVRSSLDRSFRNAPEVTYAFRVKGPVWLRLWFIMLMVIVIAGTIYFYIRYREERLKRIEREKKEKVEFEFQVLKNQVNPHFLFNSFSTLMALIEDQPEQALQYTEKLSDFFRTILQYKDQEVIKIEEEVELIGSYFFLMKKRYGDNLHLDNSLGSNFNKMFIPPMTLQILIENAIKHNVISKDKPLFIKIYEDKGKIIVENNLQPKMAADVSTGIGLENIRKRYKLITKEETVIENRGEVFRVKLPVIR